MVALHVLNNSLSLILPHWFDFFLTRSNPYIIPFRKKDLIMSLSQSVLGCIDLSSGDEYRFACGMPGT